MINEVAIIRKKRVDERGNLSGEIKYFQKGEKTISIFTL